MSSSSPPVPPKDVPPRKSSLSRTEPSEPDVKRQKGYTRPFPQPSFSNSAMHRHSVLALGKIEHLQHYFALSGKLDNKGATYAPVKSNQKHDSTYSSKSPSPEVHDLEIPLPPERDSFSPTPTAPKPESQKETRRDLLAALTACERALSEGHGLDIVEDATATIRFAQRYRAHFKHEDWEDEKKLRRDAVDVLVILRNVAEREEYVVEEAEKEVMREWCRDIRARVERDDEKRREMWERAQSWMEGNWEGNEWDRYYLLLTQFDPSEPKLPPPSTREFLDTLRTGTKLCLIHNALTHFSQRPFGLITRFHTDTNVQYRVTDNLRYFAKAAEIRWEIHLEWDVEEIWRGGERGDEMLEDGLARWCAGITEEMSRIYREEMDEGKETLEELISEMGD